MARVRFPTSSASSSLLSGSIATQIHWDRRSSRSMASASLTAPSLTALSRANSSSSWTCLTRTSCRACRENAWSCSAASTSHCQDCIGIDLEHPRGAPDTQARGQAHDDAHDERNGGVLAIKERAESLEKVAVRDDAQQLAPASPIGMAVGAEITRAGPPSSPGKSGFGQKSHRGYPLGGGVPA